MIPFDYLSLKSTSSDIIGRCHIQKLENIYKVNKILIYLHIFMM